MRRIHHDLSSVGSAAEKRTRLKPVEAACLVDLNLGAEVAGQVVHNDAVRTGEEREDVLDEASR